MLKKIGALLPILSLFIVILALLKVFIYYHNFNVPIKSFISLSELALIVSGDLFLLVPSVVFIYFFMINNGQKKSKQANEVAITEVQRVKGKVRKFLDKVMPTVLMVFFIIVMVGGPILVIYKSHAFHEQVLCYAVLIVDVYFFLFINRHEQLEELLTPGGMVLSLGLTIFLVMFVIQAAGEAESVGKGKYTGTKIFTKEYVYISSDTAFYIGQTSSYVFFYNKQQRFTTILPSTEIAKIELHSK